jgi:glycosyltransferase involved in cell wall biosynthesis
MKILFCHNYYQQSGGEDVVVANEMALLKENGHQVQLYCVSNNQIKNVWQKLLVSLRLTYSRYHKAELKKHIRQFKPDIVHVHNFFPLLTPALFDACNELNIPVVHTLHNYRLLCPSATLFINGKVNNESLTKNAYAMIKYKAYRNSYLGTFLLARAIEQYKKKNLWQTKVSQFISPSSSLKNIYTKAGFDAEKITVKPNFIQTPPFINKTGHLTNNSLGEINTKASKNPKYAIFIGRLVEEKGIKTLLSSWTNNDIELRVYGGGPLAHLFDDCLLNQAEKNTENDIENDIETKIETKINTEIKNKIKNIRYFGEVKKEEAMLALAGAQYLIMPTLWQEPFGLVTIEALSLGVPVIASNIGAIPEIITHNENGLLFNPSNHNDLKDQIDIMKCDKKRDMMSFKALDNFKKSFSATENYPQLLAIYQDAIARKLLLRNEHVN